MVALGRSSQINSLQNAAQDSAAEVAREHVWLQHRKTFWKALWHFRQMLRHDLQSAIHFSFIVKTCNDSAVCWHVSETPNVWVWVLDNKGLKGQKKEKKIILQFVKTLSQWDHSVSYIVFCVSSCDSAFFWSRCYFEEKTVSANHRLSKSAACDFALLLVVLCDCSPAGGKTAH